MPIYEYECQKCGEILEVMQKYKDPPPKSHKKCGGRKLKKVMSRSSFILKGTGWYVTDYARKGNSDTSGPKNNKPAKDDKPDKADKADKADKKDSKKGSEKSASGKNAA